MNDPRKLSRTNETHELPIWSKSDKLMTNNALADIEPAVDLDSQILKLAAQKANTTRPRGKYRLLIGTAASVLLLIGLYPYVVTKEHLDTSSGLAVEVASERDVEEEQKVVRYREHASSMDLSQSESESSMIEAPAQRAYEQSAEPQKANSVRRQTLDETPQPVLINRSTLEDWLAAGTEITLLKFDDEHAVLKLTRNSQLFRIDPEILISDLRTATLPHKLDLNSLKK